MEAQQAASWGAAQEPFPNNPSCSFRTLPTGQPARYRSREMVGTKRKPEEASRSSGQRSIKAFFAPAPLRPRPQQQNKSGIESQARESPTCGAEGRSGGAVAAASQAATAGALQGQDAAVSSASSDGNLAGSFVNSAALQAEGESCLATAVPGREQVPPQSTDGSHSQQQVCDVSKPTEPKRPGFQTHKHTEEAATGSDEQQRQQPWPWERQLRQQSSSPAARSAAAAALPDSSPASSPRGVGASCRPLVEARGGATGRPGDGASVLTALELQRLERIRRNQEVGCSAGLQKGTQL